MIPEIGQLALTFALALSLLLSVVPLYGSFVANQRALLLAKPLAIGMFLCSAFAMACLVDAFLSSDFTVINVASNSSTLLPWYYKMTASFGSHEGSMLLWVSMLTLWTALVAAFSKSLPLLMQGRILGVLGLICLGFIAFS